jgi:hypothetical protein
MYLQLSPIAAGHSSIHNLRTHHAMMTKDPLTDNIDTVWKNKDTLTDASKDVGPEVTAETTKYRLLSCHQNVRQNHDIKQIFRNCGTVQILWNGINK